MFTVNFKITNLDCKACVSLSQDALYDISDVKNVVINSETGEAVVEADREISRQEITNALHEVEKEVKFN